MSEMPHFSNIPEDPMAAIERELRERDAMRRRAVDMAWKRVDEANTEQGKLAALTNVARMLDMRNEFHKQFPEIFRDETEQ